MVLRLLSTALYVVACALAAIALLLLLLTAALLSVDVALTLRVAPLALAVTHAMPAWLSFWGVVSSPFGGVFRTDFFICALVVFLASKVVRKIAKALK